MTFPPAAFPNTLGAIRYWANHLDLGDASGKVFTGKPRGQKLPPVWVKVSSLGGTVDDHVIGSSLPDVQFDCYARDARTAEGIAWAIVAACKGLVNGEQIAEGVAASGTGDVTLAPLWRPEDEAELTRYVVGVRFRLRPLHVAA